MLIGSFSFGFQAIATEELEVVDDLEAPFGLVFFSGTYLS